MTAAAPKHESLAAALAAAQAELPAVEPNAVNPHFRSKFVSLDHLIAKTRPVLNRHGLSLSQWPTSVTLDGGLPHPALRTILRHESGEEIVDVMPLLLTKQDMQGLGAATTYGRRYAWAAALGISSDEDDDGESISANPEQQAKPKPARKPDAAKPEPAQPRPLNERKQADIHAVAKRLEDAGAVSAEQFAHVLTTEYQASDVGNLTADQGEQLLERLRKKEKELPPPA